MDLKSIENFTFLDTSYEFCQQNTWAFIEDECAQNGFKRENNFYKGVFNFHFASNQGWYSHVVLSWPEVISGLSLHENTKNLGLEVCSRQ